ncbi:MAG: hypothetical protein K6V97_04140 [Actinomycetia bacterium]|nr:hypothetical protein [Actinomycetes bacterium]
MKSPSKVYRLRPGSCAWWASRALGLLALGAWSIVMVAIWLWLMDGTR